MHLRRATLCGSRRWCSQAPPGPAKKRVPPQYQQQFGAGVTGAEAVPRSSSEGISTKFTLDEFEEKMHQRAAELEKAEVDPNASEVLQKSYQKYRETETQQERIADQDGLFNMSPSGVKAEPQRALKVFFKSVGVEEVEAGKWWAVTLDGRKATAFESTDNLVLPTEEFALAVAHEWASQKDVVHRFAMPLTDVASGAHQVRQDGVPTRLAYLLEFFRHDHMFYRSESVRDRQAALIDPVLEWADRFFDIRTPRVEGIRRAVVEPADIDKIREALVGLRMNKYQLVALTVLCQYTSSLVLPLALVHKACSLEQALAINLIEDQHNIESTTQVEGYHDVRHADSIVKMAACYNAWLMTRGVAAHDCFADPAILQKKK